MPIDEKDLGYWIDHFYGYGSWKATAWCIAFEEDGGDLPEEVAEKLRYFRDTHRSPHSDLCDIRELYRNVVFRSDGPKAAKYKTMYDYRFDDNAVPSAVWKNLTAFVHGFRNEKLPDPIAYQKNQFSSPSSHEALIRLYPLPSPHNHAWYYSWLDLPPFPFLKSRAAYLDYLYQIRINVILENITKYRPAVVVMYGMTNINRLKKSVQTHFKSTTFKTVNAIKQQLPQHHSADLKGTRLVITTQVPALKHGRSGTGFDWEKFGRHCSP